jgi:hypothetical protein
MVIAIHSRMYGSRTKQEGQLQSTTEYTKAGQNETVNCNHERHAQKEGNMRW